MEWREVDERIGRTWVGAEEGSAISGVDRMQRRGGQ